jgi:undecaprenyl-diphosphatase
MEKKYQYLLHQISWQILIVYSLFVSSLFAFTYIANENVIENETKFDRSVMTYINTHSTPLLIKVMEVVTFFGSMQFLLPAYILIIAFFSYKKNRVLVINIAIIVLSSTGAVFLLKQLFKRHRPNLPLIDNSVGYSFPSGHSVSSFVFSCILAYLFWGSSLKNTWKYFAIVLLLLFSISVGVSRIILNVHFATDVIAGFCLGIIWVLISFWILNKIEKSAKAENL